jgi:signal transduction histidine kinase
MGKVKLSPTSLKLLWFSAIYSVGFSFAIFFLPQPTLFEVNGSKILIVVVLPIIITLILWYLLRRSSNRTAMRIAWSLCWILFLINLLGILTVGLYLAPITVSLFLACSRATP